MTWGGAPSDKGDPLIQQIIYQYITGSFLRSIACTYI